MLKRLVSMEETSKETKRLLYVGSLIKGKGGGFINRGIKICGFRL